MTETLDFANARDMLALLLALETGDEDTATLIAGCADHWHMLRWALSALSAEIERQGKDTATYARDMIARTIKDETH